MGFVLIHCIGGRIYHSEITLHQSKHTVPSTLTQATFPLASRYSNIITLCFIVPVEQRLIIHQKVHTVK